MLTNFDGYPILHDSLNRFDRRAIQRRFKRAAGTFAQADFVHEHCALGLMQRLELLAATPEIVIDVGAGAGTLTRKLGKAFPRAELLALDASCAMLARARQRRFWQRRLDGVAANANALPIQSQSVDLITANLLIPWLDSPDSWAAEIQRVLKPDGAVFFSSLGPGSFVELREAWAKIDSQRHVADFVDMHDLGDALGRAGLRDPVLDTDYLRIDYQTPERLWRDLQQSGSGNVMLDRPKTLMGKRRMQALNASLGADGPFKITLELVYGHAFGGTIRTNSRKNGEVRVGITEISKRR